jgi:hypothetical protein
MQEILRCKQNASGLEEAAKSFLHTSPYSLYTLIVVRFEVLTAVNIKITVFGDTYGDM